MPRVSVRKKKKDSMRSTAAEAGVQRSDLRGNKAAAWAQSFLEELVLVASANTMH